jgi:hypothetical protein
MSKLKRSLVSVDEKFKTVIEKNTFYFNDLAFGEKYESYINSLSETLLVLKNKIETDGLKKEFIERFLFEKENGLRALLALTGFANESLKRLITVVRVADDKELSELLCKTHWITSEEKENLSEWGDTKINKLLSENEFFRKGVVNLFFEGSTIPFLAQTLPLFELKKLSISKLKFETPALIDTLVRYKEKGSYSGRSDNNAEHLIATLIKNCGQTFKKGI